MNAILKDIKTGALPAREVPGFFLWLLGKTFWFWIVLIVAGILASVVK